MLDVVLKRFEQPDEVRHFEKGKFEIVQLGGMTLGRATYEPGWRWSTRRPSPWSEGMRRRNMWVW